MVVGQPDSALGHHLDQVAGAEFKGQVPPHAQRDDLLVKMPPLEEILCRGRFSHPGGYGSAPDFSSVCTRTSLRRGRLFSGRLVGATDEEVQAAIDTAALAHPILRRAAASRTRGQLRRETPVLLRREDSSLVEGTVDLAFYEHTSDFVGWTVVDFKTDRQAETMSIYIAQVKVYSEAISAATGSQARGIILVL
jgi:hypothetical protein